MAMSIETGAGYVQAQTIKVKPDTKVLLDNMKVIDEEPYDKVIQRLCNVYVIAAEEFELEDTKYLNEETIRLLQQRLKALQEGRVMSTKQLRERLKRSDTVREDLGRGNRRRS